MYQSKDYDLYWKIFHHPNGDFPYQASPEDGHHTPKYWTELYDTLGSWSSNGEALAQLCNRLNTWVATFGILGDGSQRDDRQQQLLELHWNRMVDPRGNANLLIENEKAKLERDIALFICDTRPVVFGNIEELNTFADSAISSWCDDFAFQLGAVDPNISTNQIIEAARNTNPFI